jgi:diguanylate cyclase (GGDEF)-like protein
MVSVKVGVKLAGSGTPMKQEDAEAGTTDVYLSFVSSLFGNRKTLFTGMLLHILCCAIIYVDTGSHFFLFLIAAFIFVFFFRIYWFHQFDQVDRRRLSHAGIRRWERRYIFGAALTGGLLGLASGYTLSALPDTTAAFAAISITMGSMVAVVGRNFGSAKAVAIQMISCCVPIMAGCFLSGNVVLMLMSLMLVPFVITSLSLAKSVRGFLWDNIMAAREVVKISGQLDLALSTTAHALIMLDAQGQVLAINRRAYELLQLDPAADLKGRFFLQALRSGSAAAPGDIVDRVAQLASGGSGKMILPFCQQRWLEFSVTRQADGGVVMIFEDVTDRVTANERILHLVRYDVLTGLPNRDHFATIAGSQLAAAGSPPLAGLAIFDIDGFKHVNDMQGHVVGDGLLSAVAQRLQAVTQDDMLVGRLVGDEFLLLVTGDESTIEARMRAVHQAAQERYLVDERSLTVVINAGCVILPTAAFDLDSWQTKADLALNDAKATGNGTFTLFRAEMDEVYVQEQGLKADLRQALAHEELTVAYQPMYDPQGHRTTCCEALVRWTHAERGPIGPNIFIPLAESMGLVSRITRFVLDDDLVSYVAETLERYGLDAHRLHLEVTESCFMSEPVVVRALLSRLRASGVTIAIDDFGTGFSSLSYLDSLPVDMVKIDRTFVTTIVEDPRKLKLLRSIVHLSRDLDMAVVLEGVESEAQIALVQKYQLADLVQGFVFSRPVSSEEIARLLMEQTRRSPEAAAP